MGFLDKYLVSSILLIGAILFAGKVFGGLIALLIGDDDDRKNWPN